MLETSAVVSHKTMSIQLPIPVARLPKEPKHSVQPLKPGFFSFDSDMKLESNSVSSGMPCETANKNGFQRILEATTLDYSVYDMDFAKKGSLSKLMSRRNQYFSPYMRIFSCMILANLVGLIFFLYRNQSTMGMYNLEPAITASAGNILLAILIRQEYIVNSIYRLCWYVPHSLPMWMRTRICKFYEHGGLHSGAGIGGALWLAVLSSLGSINYIRGAYSSTPMLSISFILLLLMLAIIIPSMQLIRFHHHNCFELSHRFFGWTAIAIFWVQVSLFVYRTALETNRSPGQLLLRTPAFWMLGVITFHIILPWINLRRMKFTPTVILTGKALRLDFQTPYPHISGIGLSLSPLLEWHAFATYPRPKDGPNCHSIIMARAGDWTSAQIKNPSTHYWIKGIPKTGLLSLSMMFSRIVVVTTGSGIAPCISMTMSPYARAQRTQVSMIWNAPNPREIYGDDFYDDVVDGHAYTMVIDSKKTGRAELGKIAYAVWKEQKAEAVFVISNRDLTIKIVHELEEMGVPAFGPIWDS
jgi:hypothetical protein